MKCRRLFAIGACLPLFGCAGPAPAPTQNTALNNAQKAAASATQAYSQGQPERAAQAWQQAMYGYDGLGDSVGSARAVLGLSRALVDLGQYTQALAVVDRALSSASPLPRDVRVGLLGRRSSLRMATQGEAAAVKSDLQEALSLCEPDCPEKPALLGLESRRALNQNDASLALNQARTGLEWIKRHPQQTSEQANLLRLCALAERALGQPKQAVASAEKALELDQASGQIARIAMDYELLAQLARDLGDEAKADLLTEKAQLAKAAWKALGPRGLP